MCVCAGTSAQAYMCACVCMGVCMKSYVKNTNDSLFPFSVRRYAMPARLFTQQRARTDFVTKTPRAAAGVPPRSVGRRRNAISAVYRRAHEEHTGAHSTHANARRQATGTGGGPAGAPTHTNTNAHTQLGASERTLRNNILNAHTNGTRYFTNKYTDYYNTIV